MHFLKIARNYIKHLTSYILLAIGKEKKMVNYQLFITNNRKRKLQDKNLNKYSYIFQKTKLRQKNLEIKLKQRAQQFN